MDARRFVAVLGLAGAMVFAGCSSSKSSTPATTSGLAGTATTQGGSSSTTAAGGGQKLTITPSSSLASPQTVQLEASGFSPHESLTVAQCADKGNNTGPGDCNLGASQMVTSDSTGHVSLRFTVVKGPFGDNKIVCSASQRCLVSVTQASIAPTQEADAPISFR